MEVTGLVFARYPVRFSSRTTCYVHFVSACLFYSTKHNAAVDTVSYRTTPTANNKLINFVEQLFSLGNSSRSIC